MPRLFGELRRLRSWLDGQLHVIMIDDGSTDRTGTILRAQLEQPWISVLSTTKRRGQHRALLRGMEEVLTIDGVDVVGTMDADMDPPPEAFLALLPYAASYDLVIGQRQKRPRSLVRKAVSFVLLLSSWLLRPTRIRDHGSMFRLYGTNLCRRCLRLRTHGAFLAGVSLLAAEQPVEVPVQCIVSVPRSSRYSARAVCDAGIQMLRLLARHPFGLFRKVK